MQVYEPRGVDDSSIRVPNRKEVNGVVSLLHESRMFSSGRRSFLWHPSAAHRPQLTHAYRAEQGIVDTRQWCTRQNVQGAAPQSANPPLHSNQTMPTQKGSNSATWRLPNGASWEVGLRLVTW